MAQVYAIFSGGPIFHGHHSGAKAWRLRSRFVARQGRHGGRCIAPRFPLWSPNGLNIVFESIRKGSYDLWIKPSNGAGTEEPLLGTPNQEWPLDWSKDGRFILYDQIGQKTGSDLLALPMTGDDRKPIVIANTPFEERNGQFSPDTGGSHMKRTSRASSTFWRGRFRS